VLQGAAREPSRPHAAAAIVGRLAAMCGAVAIGVGVITDEIMVDNHSHLQW
jgi:hypothetical protein